MANQTVNFAAQVIAWVKETQDRMDTVFKESCQDLLSEMQTPVAEGGNMPVDTGFLRASVRVNTDGFRPATLTPPSEASKFTYNPAAAVLAILGAEIGDTVFMSYTANYARPVHYGSGDREGRQWVTMAAQRWPQIVAAACGRLQTASTANGGS